MLATAPARILAAPALPPALTFEEPQANFGDAYQGSTIVHRFAVSNQGSRPVVVKAVEPRADEGGWGEALPPVLAPGSRGEIVVHQPTGERLGASTFRIRITTDDPTNPMQRVGLSGFVQSAYEPETPRLEFGTVDRAAGQTLDLDLYSRDVGRLAVESVTGAPEFLDVRVAGRAGDAGEGLRLRATLRPGAPLGLQAGSVTIRANVSVQPELVAHWSANVFEDAVPSANPVELGLARIGEALSADVLLRSRSGAPLAIQRVEDPSGRVGVTVLPCPSESGAPGLDDPSCRLLRLRHLPGAFGTVDGDLRIFLVGRDDAIPLRYTGMAVGAGAEIRNVDLRGADSGLALPPARGTARVAQAPVSAVSVGATPAPTIRVGADAPTTSPARAIAIPFPPTPPGPNATLRWQVAEENGVYGYLVLRAEDRLGPYARVNREIVRVPDDGGSAGHSYVYVDEGVQPGTTYYYYLDLVTTAGLKRRFSGVLTKTIAAK